MHPGGTLSQSGKIGKIPNRELEEISIDLKLGGTEETVRGQVKGVENVFKGELSEKGMGMRDIWSFEKTHQCIWAYYSLFKRRAKIRSQEVAAVTLWRDFLFSVSCCVLEHTHNLQVLIMGYSYIRHQQDILVCIYDCLCVQYFISIILIAF